MQIWIHYLPGAGGDGFCNLLEHTNEVLPLDRALKWRVHRYVDDQVKFWAPTVDHDGTFRSNKSFDLSCDLLTDDYKTLVAAGVPIVISSHLGNMSYLNSGQGPWQLHQDRISIWLYSNKRNVQCVDRAMRLNLMEYDINNYVRFRESAEISPKADTYVRAVCIEEIQQDKLQFFNLLDELGLTMDEQWYHEYLAISKNAHKITTPGVQYWESYLEGTLLKYRRIS